MSERGRDGRGELHVAADPEALARVAAERFVLLADDSIAATGGCTVALSGGSTPLVLYDLLATPGFEERVAWERVHVFWSDERCVPPDDENSNFRAARESLLDQVPLRAGHIHRIRGEARPDEAAREYEELLRRAFGAPQGPPPTEPGRRFDLVLLGLGADGHTASLFPGAEVLTAEPPDDRWVVPAHSPASPRDRVTLTPPVLNAAAEVWFLVTGEDKAATLARVLEGSSGDPEPPPVHAIRPVAGVLHWFADAAAAGKLST